MSDRSHVEHSVDRPLTRPTVPGVERQPCESAQVHAPDARAADGRGAQRRGRQRCQRLFGQLVIVALERIRGGSGTEPVATYLTLPPGLLATRSPREATERTVFRVDHVLGMATAQNLLGLRLADRILEAVWDSTHAAGPVPARDGAARQRR